MASSGPANAIKAAALYNLRLKQLQLFLQSLPEEQRPHSIPELKALLQRGGGPLGVLVSLSLSAPLSPTLAPSPTGPECSCHHNGCPNSAYPALLHCWPDPANSRPVPASASTAFPTPLHLSCCCCCCQPELWPASSGQCVSSLSDHRQPALSDHTSCLSSSTFPTTVHCGSSTNNYTSSTNHFDFSTNHCGS